MRADARLAALGVLLTAAATAVDTRPGASRPNVVLIVADDLGYTDLGVLGAETSDRDLLGLVTHKGIAIVPPRGFWSFESQRSRG